MPGRAVGLVQSRGSPTRSPRTCRSRGNAAPRRAARGSREPRVRQNLALVVGLQGRFAGSREDRARRPARRSRPRPMSPICAPMLTQQNRGTQEPQGLSRRALMGPTQRGRRCRHATGRSRSAARPRCIPITGSRPAENDDEQHRQEEQDHRHRQLGRQRGGLLLGFRSCACRGFPAAITRSDCAERRAVALRLGQRHRRPT